MPRSVWDDLDEFYETYEPENYSYERYTRDMASLTSEVARTAGSLAIPYQDSQTSRAKWINYLASIYPFVANGRRSAAKLARKFYDSERAKHTEPIEAPLFDNADDGILVDDRTTLTVKLYPRFPFNVPHYEPDWFEEALEPSRKKMEPANARDSAVLDTVARVAKEVENGARHSTIETAERDKRVDGYARVEGNENIGSCGFCAMLISRGPIYNTKRQAGIKSNETADSVIRRANEENNYELLKKLTNYWHPSCDCKIVPVFDRFDNWPGKSQYEAMEQLWLEVMKQDRERIREDERRFARDGKSHNPAALNAFRRRLERGDLPPGITRQPIK